MAQVVISSVRHRQAGTASGAKFTGQGIENGASRGDVFFRIKGDDVVVTKPDGSFVTILKDGINNTSVKNALKGDPK